MNHWIDDSAAPGHPDTLRMALAFASAGLAPPAPGAVCTLGGAGQPADPQPQDQAIAAFCERADLPDFAVITMHCPWSGLLPDVQAVVTDFVRRKLKAGGVFAVSYHCQPGWAPMAPVRSLLARAALPGAGLIGSTPGTPDFAGSLLTTEPAYFGAYPRVAEDLRSLRAQPGAALLRTDLRHWQPVSFAGLADQLGAAKLTFACPIDYLDHVADLHLTGPQQALLAELADPVFAESVRDIMLNRSVRADYWVKGARPLSPLQQLEARRRPVMVLAAPPPSLAPVPGTWLHAAPGAANSAIDNATSNATSNAISIATSNATSSTANSAPNQAAPSGANSVANQAAPGGANSRAVHAPLLALMADRQPRTIGALAGALQGAELSLQQVFEAVLVLVATGRLTLASA